MSTVASTLAAMACANCARPISPPSLQTAALLDMFCALKGATRKLWRDSMRHNPATSVLLPTDDAVPCTIRTGASSLMDLREEATRRDGAGLPPFGAGVSSARGVGTPRARGLGGRMR